MYSKEMTHRASVLLVALATAGTTACDAAQTYPAPVDVVAAKDGKALYVAESAAGTIAVVSIPDGEVGKRMKVSAPINSVGISAANGDLVAACGVADGKAVVLDPKTGKVSSTIRVGHTPMSPVVSPDGKTLYVCNRFDNDISIVDLESGKETARVKVAREPIGAVLTHDGKYLFVANHLPEGRADSGYVAACVSVIDTAKNEMVAKIMLPNGSTSLRDICISPDGKYVYVTHILARYHVPTTQLERGWMNTNAMTIIDAAERKLLNTVLLDDISQGAANPWGVACTPDGRFVCVALAGTHEIAVIDSAEMHARLARAVAEDVPNDLSFLVGCKRRLKLAGNGPRGLTVVGSMVYAAEHFSDSVGGINVETNAVASAVSFRLADQQDMSVVRRGEMLFNDADMCFQKWQSCASCHPDSRNDALNWDLLNDGIGNPKQTKSLLLAHKTPPVMVTGIREKAEVAVRAGMKYIQFAVRPEEDAVAIDEYLKSMKPVPSPYLVKGRLSDSAKRGKKIFSKANCTLCHPAPLFTSKSLSDVGTGTGREDGRKFNAPTLVEVWRTAPYLYDGRAATIRDVLTVHNKDNKHGSTSRLGAKAIADLEAYVLSQ